MINDSETGSQVCFGGSDDDSSVGSVSGGGSNNGGNANGGAANPEGPCGRGAAADGCGGAAAGGKSGVGSSASELPSIVERNARIIKWLWNCRKANAQQQQKGQQASTST